jgi:hypothetical protein
VTNAELRMACTTYNATLLNQPKDSRDQPAAMRAALGPFLERIKALEDENAQFRAWQLRAQRMIAAMKANAVDPARVLEARPMTGFVATLTAEQKQAAITYEGDDHHGLNIYAIAEEADQ